MIRNAVFSVTMESSQCIIDVNNPMQWSDMAKKLIDYFPKIYHRVIHQNISEGDMEIGFQFQCQI